MEKAQSHVFVPDADRKVGDAYQVESGILEEVFREWSVVPFENEEGPGK